MHEQYLALTDRILLLAYKLEHYRFTTPTLAQRWHTELDELLARRARIPRK